MTVLELRILLRKLPPDMEIMVPFDDILITACYCETGVCDMKDIDDENVITKVFVVAPCLCDIQDDDELN